MIFIVTYKLKRFVLITIFQLNKFHYHVSIVIMYFL